MNRAGKSNLNQSKLQSTFTNIGASSLLVIFIVLCIALFATLSLSSAKSDYSFSEKTAQHKTDYYEASNTSEQILDEVDAILEETAREASGQQVFFTAVKSALPQTIRGIPITSEEDGVVSWQIPIDETQALSVELAIHLPSEETRGFYTIQAWKTTGIE